MEQPAREQLEKLENLALYLKKLKSVAVAFSSGVDSTFLLKAAHDTLGANVIAVTARSCSFPQRELDEAAAFCKKEGIRHFICDSEEFEIRARCGPAGFIRLIFVHYPNILHCQPGRSSPLPVSHHALYMESRLLRRSYTWSTEQSSYF